MFSELYNYLKFKLHTLYTLSKLHFSLLTVFLISFILVGTSCTSQHQNQETKQYLKEINSWHQQRIESLEEPDSWLSLTGLYSLEEGRQTFGADSSNDIVFPSRAPNRIGTITKKGDSFLFQINNGITVLNDSTQIKNIEIRPSEDVDPTVLRHNSLIWYIIERRGTYYIRLKDENHPNFSSFDGIERFPVSPDWRIEATFHPFDKVKTVTIPDILGESYQDSLYGTLEFTVEGENYSIAPLGHPQKDDEFFIIFGDQSNGESTYSGGRYLYIPTPDEGRRTYIDFNKAYNPPCVFTNYATCPLPPKQNQLDLEVTAGEKVYMK
jgi:uncharacterized protein (DUF1684 family)